MDVKFLLLLLLVLPSENLVQSRSLQHLGGTLRALSASFANGKSREGALVGYSEDNIHTSIVADADLWCTDKQEFCQSWAKDGECTKNPDFMQGACMKSCNTCSQTPQVGKRCKEADECQRVFFDIEINGEKAGRILMDLFNSVVPKTAKNFFELTTRTNCGFKGTRFYRIIPGFMSQGGRTCSGSIYGATFPDENFELNFSKPYLLGMANAGPNTNGVDFFITVAPAHHLDGKFVVFGSVVSGFSLVQSINALGTNSFAGPTKADIRIVDTGHLPWTTMDPSQVEH